MVNLVEAWADIEDYAQRCRYGSYQQRDTVDGTEIRVHIGRFGYIHVFQDPEDPQLQHIIKFCKAEEIRKKPEELADQHRKLKRNAERQKRCTYSLCDKIPSQYLVNLIRMQLAKLVLRNKR